MNSDNNGLKTTEQKKTPYLTQPVIYGMHAYRRPGEDSSVYFVDEERGIRKMLVDQEGNIQKFHIVDNLCNKLAEILAKQLLYQE